MWGNTYDYHLEPLVLLQKRAVRLIVGARKYEHTEPIFDTLKILKLKEIYIYSVQLFLFKFHYNKLPELFDDFYQSNYINNYHDIDTRHQRKFRPSMLKNFPACRTVRVTGVQMYNYFSSVLNFDCSLLTFKYHLKKHILSNTNSIIKLTLKKIDE